MGTDDRTQEDKPMARRNQGPKLKWHRSGSGYYICWNERGRYFERTTGTKDREEAEIVFAEWMQSRRQASGPSDPAKILVTAILHAYAANHGPSVMGKETLANNITRLASHFEGKTVAEVPGHIPTYLKKRGVASGTMRRELGVLRSAINYAFKNRIITQPVAFKLPDDSPTKERCLTEAEDPSASGQRIPDVQLFTLIALYTGRRAEAIMSLRWERIDFGANTIDFEIPGRKATKKRRGVCRIPDELRPHLAEAKRRGTDIGPVFHISGRAIKSLRKGFEAACRRAGVEEESAATR